MPIGLLRADNNLPPWRSGLNEVSLFEVICVFWLSSPLVLSLATSVSSFYEVFDHWVMVFSLLYLY